MSNTVLIKLLVGLFLVSFGAADHIIMTRQESKLPRPTKTIIARLQYNFL